MTQFCFLCKYIQTPTKYKSSKYQTQFHAHLDYTHFAYCRNVDTLESYTEAYRSKNRFYF
jgi:hypothetical protein